MQVKQFSSRSYRSIFKWGDPEVFYDVDDRLRSFIQQRLGLSRKQMELPHLPGLDEVEPLGDPDLPPGTLASLKKAVGEDNVSTGSYDRAAHAYGSTFLDLIRLRKHQVENAPDAVCYPRSEQDVVRLVDICREKGIALVPAGGRSSVTRGIELIRDTAPRSGICLDLTRHMNRVIEVSPKDLTARVQPGIYGPAYEEHLNELGFTCGHFPQSFEYSTVGGWVATRGAGQQSTYFGKIEDMVLGCRCVTPKGLIATKPYPRAALGPSIDGMLVGSEGSYGVLSEVTLRVFPHRPKGQLPITFMFRDFQSGVTCLREILQGGFGKPGVFRLSDGEETDVALALDGLSGGSIDRTLSGLGYKPGRRCLMIAATEGDAATAVYTAARAHAVAVRRGGLPLGPVPLTAWRKRRFHDPYLRDDLMDMGVLTDTLETSVPWSGLYNVWNGVRRVIKDRPDTVGMAHISHAYENGANLYFIFLSPMDRGNEVEDYRAYHQKIIDAVVENGGALSHHHGIGRLLAPWFRDHIGPVAHDTLRAIKNHLDEKGICNPGALDL
jgi:alkyldihydroxyacetonephosphate synthase